MTTLYKPVLIESAEQAEALPVGTVATNGTRAAIQQRFTSPWGTPGVSWWITDDDWDPSFISEEVVGWTALVPIEAEEEWSEDYGGYHLLEAITGPRPFIAYTVEREEA